MSGYALEYDAAVWRALPTADRAAAFALGLDEELRRERPDLTEVELAALRETAERAAASRPRDASESFLFLPVDVGGIGIAHLSVVVPGADEVYDASDVVAAATDALLPPTLTEVDVAGLGRGHRVLTVAPGGDELPSARVEYLFTGGPAVLLVSALARSVRDAALMAAALDELLASFRWQEG